MNPRIEPAGDHALLITFGSGIHPDVHECVRRAFHSLRDPFPRGVLNLHPAYASLLVDFDPLLADRRGIESEVKARLEAPPPPEALEVRRLEIPVCYGRAFGPDLEAVAAHCGLSQSQVVRRHSNREYLVYFLGFSPGFPYLGGLDPLLATPRLAAPRTEIPAGSVAIGGSQTGIYPTDSPGGWRIIGRTPARLFSAARPPYATLAMGDRVRFLPISARQFEAWG